MPVDWSHWHEKCPLEGRALTNTKEATKCAQFARNSPKLTRHYARTSLSRRSTVPAGPRRNPGVRGLFLEHNGYAEITIHFPTRWTCPDRRSLVFFWAPATISKTGRWGARHWAGPTCRCRRHTWRRGPASWSTRWE